MSAIQPYRKIRSKTSLSDLPSNWKDIIMHCAARGEGKPVWCSLLGISIASFDAFAVREEELAEVVEDAMTLQEAWYERQANRMIAGGDGNVRALVYMFYRKFGYGMPVSDRPIREPVVQIVNTQNNNVVNNLNDEELTKEQIVAELEKRGLPTEIFKKRNAST